MCIYVCIYIYIHIYIICMYIYIYIYIYVLSSSRKPSGRFLLFMVSVVDIIQRLFMMSVVGFLMASVVAGNICLWFPSLVFSWFPSWQENMFYGFRRWTLGGFCHRRRIHKFRMYRAIPSFFWCFQDWFPSLFFLCNGFRRGMNKFYFYGFRRLCFWVSVVARNVFVWFPSLVSCLYGFRLLQDRGCLSDGSGKKDHIRTFP